MTNQMINLEREKHEYLNQDHCCESDTSLLDEVSLKIMSTAPLTDLFQDVFYERVEVRYQI